MPWESTLFATPSVHEGQMGIKRKNMCNLFSLILKTIHDSKCFSFTKYLVYSFTFGRSLGLVDLLYHCFWRNFDILNCPLGPGLYKMLRHFHCILVIMNMY